MESSILLWKMLSLNFKKMQSIWREKIQGKSPFFPYFLFVRFNEGDDDKKMKHKTAHDDKQTPPYHPFIVQCLEHI